MNKILSISFCLFLLLPTFTFGQKYEKTILQDSVFSIVIKGDSSNLDRIQLFVKYPNFSNDSSGLDNKAGQVNLITIDTLLNNVNKPYYSLPMRLQYVGIHKPDYICLVFKAEMSYKYVIFKKADRFNLYMNETLDWGSKYFSTTVKVHNCFTVEVRNGQGDFLWSINPETKALTKSEITTEKH